MRPNQRTAALNAALRLMSAERGGAITLDGVARETGMTKAGLMYHFPTREELMLAIIDHAAASLEHAMQARLGKPVHEATPSERIRAYADVASHGSKSRAEYAMYAEAAYRPELSAPWKQRMTRWFELPGDLHPDARARLITARLAADGLWAAEATGVFPPSHDDRDAVINLITSLTAESDNP